jgi:hypothetical protein
MRLIVSEPAAELIGERGGRLYVWLTHAKCCGGVTQLASATNAPAGKQFRRVEAAGDLELYVPQGLTRLPDELYVELRRFPRKLESYWNGCAWVV